MTREEAIKRIKSRYDKWALDDKDLEAIQCTFPELHESEDERIRKFLIDILSSGVWRTEWPFSPVDCVAYLEKQKEQNPNIELIQRSWYMEGYHDREFGMEPKWTVKAEKGGPRFYENPNYGKPLKQKEQEPIPDSVKFDEGFKTGREVGFREGVESVKPTEWSEEDEKIRRNLMSLLATMRGDRITEETYQKYYPWLKSLCPQPQWKPSEERLSALLAIFNDPNNIGSQTCQLALSDLYEQLKKLM